MEHELITRNDVEEQVCPVLLQLTEPDSGDDFRTEAVTVRHLTDSFFLAFHYFSSMKGPSESLEAFVRFSRKWDFHCHGRSWVRMILLIMVMSACFPANQTVWPDQFCSHTFSVFIDSEVRMLWSNNEQLKVYSVYSLSNFPMSFKEFTSVVCCFARRICPDLSTF